MTSASAGEALREFFWGKKRHGFSAMRRKSHVGLMLGDCVHIEGGFLSHRQLCRAPRSIKLFYNQQLIILSSSKLVQKFQDKRGKGYVRKFVKNLELFFNLKSMNISFKKKRETEKYNHPPKNGPPSYSGSQTTFSRFYKMSCTHSSWWQAYVEAGGSPATTCFFLIDVVKKKKTGVGFTCRSAGEGNVSQTFHRPREKSLSFFLFSPFLF